MTPNQWLKVFSTMIMLSTFTFGILLMGNSSSGANTKMTLSDSCIVKTQQVSTQSDYYRLAETRLVYSTEDLDIESLKKFVELVKDKKLSGWSNEMIEIHLITNIAERIKKEYPKLKKEERLMIAEEMIKAILEKILQKNLTINLISYSQNQLENV